MSKAGCMTAVRHARLSEPVLWSCSRGALFIGTKHEFAGALLGKQGDRGVFITTSAFCKGARDEAERINGRIELIDGTRLAELLVACAVGVQAEQTVTLSRLDEDFFETSHHPALSTGRRKTSDDRCPQARRQAVVVLRRAA